MNRLKYSKARDISPRFYLWGQEKCPKNHHVGPYIRFHYILHLVLGGKGTLITGGKKYQLSEGQIFILYPGEKQEYYPDPSDPWEYTWVNFMMPEAQEMLSKTGFSLSSAVTQKFSTDETRPFFDAFMNPHKKCYETAYMHMLLGFLADKFPACEKEKTAEKLFLAAELIKDRYYDSDLSVEVTAHEAGLSREHLFRLFKQKFEMPPSDYIVSVRIGKAAELLLSSDLAVKNVAYSVGFEDPMYFSRAFKKVTGTTPSEYRKAGAEKVNQAVLKKITE